MRKAARLAVIILLASLVLPPVSASAVEEAAHATGASVRLGPGAMIFARGGASCTAGFVFENIDSGDLALTTAGHCFDEGARIAAYGGPFGNVEFGTVVLRVKDEGVGNDFALVQVDRALRPHVVPTVPLLGGPCGWRSPQGIGETVALVGRTFLFEGTAKPRFGITRAGPDSPIEGHPHIVHYAVPRTGGDSGGPVLFVDEPETPGAPARRLAAAIHTQGGPGHGTPLGAGTSMQHALSLAGPSWRLVESPDCHRASGVPPWGADVPQGATLRDEDGDGRVDGLRVHQDRYEVDADPSGAGARRTGEGDPVEVSTLSRASADANDVLASVLQHGQPVELVAPDGRSMEIRAPGDRLLFVVISLDGRVLEAKEWGHGIDGCVSYDAASILVEGDLMGAAADGTWRVTRSGDYTLTVQGKQLVHAAQPHAVAPSGCPSSQWLEPLPLRTWNWHETDGEHRVGLHTAALPPENPAFARLYPSEV